MEREAVWRHVAPFVVWVGIMTLPFADLAIRYALQTVAGLLALLVARPWRYYPPASIRFLPAGLGVGVLVFALWVLPESHWAERWPACVDLYRRFAIRGVAEQSGVSPFAPKSCGWLLSAVRLAGSALVIAVAEEFFWRGFLLRWLKGRPFHRVAPGAIGWGFLLASACLFGLEHSRWVAGILAGLAYGLLYIRTGDLWASIAAHVTTNALLGLYVLATASCFFW